MGVTQAVSDTCAVIAFYGISSRVEAARGFYETVVDWFWELGCPPDKLSVHGPGHSGKPGPFPRVDAKLRRNGFDDVSSVFVVSMTPDGWLPVNDYLCAADWAGEQSWSVVSVRTSLARLSENSCLPMVQRLVGYLRPEYGIGFTRKHNLGPAMYAIGINQGTGIPTNEAEANAKAAISRWSDAMFEDHIWRDGIIRDVYPWNFLTRPQLDRPVGKVPLGKWIEMNASRGRLRVLDQGVTLWEVDEQRIPALHQQLWDAGVIFDWRDDAM